MAEFRQDWVNAVGQYRAAYAALKTVPLGQPQPSVQRHAEVGAAADFCMAAGGLSLQPFED